MAKLKFTHKLFGMIHPVMKIVKFKQNSVQNSTGAIRVLIYHQIDTSEIHEFRNQINWLQKNTRIISPLEFELILTNPALRSQNYVMITFDDGYFSNRIVAEEVLNPLGIKALFFVVKSFIEISSSLELQKFILTNYFPSVQQDKIPNNLKNMGWDDIRYLINTGHMIGSHTKTHRRLSTIKEYDDLEDEIVGGGNELEKILGITVNHFAFPFGNIDSYNEMANRIAKKRYKYIYSGLRGNNKMINPGQIIRRDAINLNYTKKIFQAFVEGHADFLYRKKTKILDSWK